MISFKTYIEQENFILQLVEELFDNETLLEANFDIPKNSNKIKYQKENGQFVACSTHTKDYNDREWYSSYTDKEFTTFSEKVLSALKNWNNLPTNSLVGGEKKPNKEDETKLGVCDTTQTYGWKIAIKPSFNEKKTPDSCYVITVLNKNADSMNKNFNIFTIFNKGRNSIDDYIVNIDKIYLYKGKSESEIKSDLQKCVDEIEKLNRQIEDLKYKVEYAELEYEETPSIETKKNIDSLKVELKLANGNLTKQINTKTNLEKVLTESFKVCTISKDNKKAQILIL